MGYIVHMFFFLWRHITIMLHGRYGVSNHRQLDLFWLTATIMSKFHINCPLWGESTGHRWIPLTKGQVMRKVYPWHDVIMLNLAGNKPSIIEGEIDLEWDDIQSKSPDIGFISVIKYWPPWFYYMHELPNMCPIQAKSTYL